MSTVETKIPKISEMARPLKWVIQITRLRHGRKGGKHNRLRPGCCRCLNRIFKARSLRKLQVNKVNKQMELRTIIPAKAIIPIMEVAVNCDPACMTA